MKLFSKARNQLVKTSGFSKYLVYAFGEIILVVTGILIALSINNWSEDKKQAKNLDNILHIFRSDIVRDTTRADYIIKYYKKQDSVGRLALSDSISKDFYKKNGDLQSIIFTGIPLAITRNGYDLLKNYSYDVEIAQDSTVVYGLALYNEINASFIDLNTKIEKDVYENTLNMKENYNFAADMYMRRENQKARDYFKSDDFKNRLALNLQLKAQGAISLLQGFNAASKMLLEKMDKRLNN